MLVRVQQRAPKRLVRGSSFGAGPLSPAQYASDETRVQTHKIHHTIAATRQTEARKLRASLS